MRKFFGVLCCFGLLASGVVYADDSGGLLSVSLTGGSSGIAGSLSENPVAQSWGTRVGVYPNTRASEALGGMRGHFDLNFYSTLATVDDESKFAFKPGSSLSLFRTSLSPMLCAMSDMSIQACIGAGLALVEVRDSENSQAYGSYVWSAKVGHYFRAGLTGGFGISYYRVRQKVDGQTSHFAVTDYVASLGWAWEASEKKN